VLVFAYRVKIAAGCFVSALALSGCASGRIDVAEQGVRPELAQGSLGAPEAPPAAGRTLIEDLAKAGLMADAAGRPARIIDLGYSERPLKVGAYSGPPPTEDGWIASPEAWSVWRPRQRMICTLSMRISGGTESSEPYEVRASRRGRGAACGGQENELTAAIVSRLELP
jgi:hypothetical protein